LSEITEEAQYLPLYVNVGMNELPPVEALAFVFEMYKTSLKCREWVYDKAIDA
jgi:hypothetical protein